MNWYLRLVTAQLWNVKSGEGFSDELRRFYELEYKYSQTKLHQFSGNPRRRESLLKNLALALNESGINIAETLTSVFGKWLNHHALTDPNQFAGSRTESNLANFENWGDSNPWDIFVSEYERYANWANTAAYMRGRISPANQTFKDILLSVEQNPNAYPAWKQFAIMLQQELIPSYREDMQEENNGQPLTPEQEQQLQIMESEIDSISDVFDMRGIGDFNSLSQSINEHGANENAMMQEVYAKMLHPNWLSHWRDQGIDEVRDNIEMLYNQLRALQQGATSEIMIKTINLSLNATHMSGDMLEYVEESTNESNLSDLLSYLSNDNHDDVDRWNNELRAVGVKVPIQIA